MNFGEQKKERDVLVSKLMKEKGAIWKLDANDDSVDVGSNRNASDTNGRTNDVSNDIVNSAPKLKDIIGSSLKYVGTYKNLDNKKQVVALIDDVSGWNCFLNCSLINNDKYSIALFVTLFVSRIYA